MSAVKNNEQHTDAELADALVFPVKLSARQKKEAETQLKKAREKVRLEATEEDSLTARLLQLRFRLEEYLNSDSFDPVLTFSYFLKEYVSILNKKRKVFAEEISIDETMLSQFINTHRMPPDYLTIRLELHSNNMIPAHYWYGLVEKQKEHEIKTDKALRKKEMKYVHSKLAVSA